MNHSDLHQIVNMGRRVLGGGEAAAPSNANPNSEPKQFPQLIQQCVPPMKPQDQLEITPK